MKSEGLLFSSSLKLAIRVVRYFLFFSAGYGFSISAAIVETIGRAPEDSRAYREQALSDALREAVRVGAGINLASQSKSGNYALDFDRIFTASFGYVRSYKVIQTGVQHGVYFVKIQADVSEGDLKTNDEMALRQLISLKKSPAIAVSVDQDVTFVPRNSNYVADWFLEHAKKLHLQVVDFGEGNSTDHSYSTDYKTNPNDNSLSRKYDYDFLIRGKLEGKYEILGSDKGSPYSLSANFDVVAPETGEIIASLAMSPASEIKSSIQSPKIAARDIIFKYLNGDQSTNNDGAEALFRRIFSRWSADLDLGRSVQIEIEGIGTENYQRLMQHLDGQERISFVESKFLDPRGVSKLVVETRYVQPELLEIIQKKLIKTHNLSFSSHSVARFEPKKLSFLDKVVNFFVD